MSIQVLSESVVNQIAAGEVVERPAHLIKELLENSIDAQATDIQIDFDHGGQQVTIKDNGTGIAPGELRLALSRHATSKIRNTDDIWRLNSFGFRGEALASIASVSKMLVKSKTADADFAAMIECDFGNMGKEQKTQAEKGTLIRIEQLFDNVPARKKFLKSEASESTQIKNIIKALAIANPTIGFRARQGEKWSVYWPPAPSLIERVRMVLDLQELFEQRYESGGWKVQAVVASPHHVVANTKQIWIFVNGRYVQDRNLQVAVLEAYRSLLMHGEYPIAVIDLRCPPGEVDVNVHPTKSQIKFRDSSSAFRVVHKCVRDILEAAPWLEKNISLSQPIVAHTSPTFTDSTISFSDAQISRSQFYQRSDALSVAEPSTPTASAVKSVEAPGAWTSLDIVGQLLHTYIVTQNSDQLVLIDQHAAHERVLFERLMRDWRSGDGESQALLIPLSVDLDENQVEGLSPYLPELLKFGLDVDVAGPANLAVRAIPALLTDEAVVVCLQKMADDVSERGASFQLEHYMSEVFASLACHSAIRAGKALTMSEMQSLLQQMDEFSMSSFCPHGRPVSVEVSRTELERRFGRIT